MPFKSEAQRRWMYENKPEMAKEYEQATPKGRKLPERVQPKQAAKPPLTSKLAFKPPRQPSPRGR